MTNPLTQPGWYRADPKGLERVAGPDDPPGDITELVKVEFSEAAAQESLFGADYDDYDQDHDEPDGDPWAGAAQTASAEGAATPGREL